MLGDMIARPARPLRHLLATSLIGLACSSWAGPTTPPVSAEQRQRLGIVVTPVEAVNGAWQSYPAEIVVPPAQERVVAAPVAGLVEALAVGVGDSVRAGQWLVWLRSGQTQELRRDVLQSGSQLSLARSQLARDEALFKEGLIPQARLDAARAQAQQAQALADERRSALQATTARAVVGADGMLSLSAPITGQILEQLVQVGQRVEAMTPLYRLASLKPLWVNLQVPSRETASIRAGDKVVLPAPTPGDHDTPARVVAVSPVVDARSQSRTVRAQLDDSARGWQPGQLVEARLQRQAAASGTRVPADAVMPTAGNGHQVFVARPAGRFELLDVQLRAREGGTVTLEALPTGTQVVSRGTAALKAMLPR